MVRAAWADRKGRPDDAAEERYWAADFKRTPEACAHTDVISDADWKWFCARQDINLGPFHVAPEPVERPERPKLTVIPACKAWIAAQNGPADERARA